MQKYKLLLVFMLSPFVTCAMENDSSRAFVIVRSFLPKWLINSSVPLSPMQKLQADKNKFEDWLWDTSWWVSGYSMDTSNGLPVSGYYIHQKPVKFLKYCFMQYRHKKSSHKTNMLSLFGHDRFVGLANKCRKVRKKGYSALGAAIIARGVSSDDKRNFIEQLMHRGFTLSEKDKTLVHLTLYEIISAEVLSLLHDKQGEGSFSVLPLDVRNHIVCYSADLLKEKEWISLLLSNFFH